MVGSFWTCRVYGLSFLLVAVTVGGSRPALATRARYLWYLLVIFLPPCVVSKSRSFKVAHQEQQFLRILVLGCLVLDIDRCSLLIVGQRHCQTDGFQ